MPKINSSERRAARRQTAVRAVVRPREPARDRSARRSGYLRAAQRRSEPSGARGAAVSPRRYPGEYMLLIIATFGDQLT